MAKKKHLLRKPKKMMARAAKGVPALLGMAAVAFAAGMAGAAARGVVSAQAASLYGRLRKFAGFDERDEDDTASPAAPTQTGNGARREAMS